jgi:Lon-like ATP-dependent protease
MHWTILISGIQLFFSSVIGLYFWNLLRNQQNSKTVVQKESHKEMEQLRRLRAISLTEPLSEKTRPSRFEDIVGQEDGLRALRAALCGSNPQHVLIYGPPGVGKTAAARLVLEEARKNPLSPFRDDAKFVEMDATTARFDERGIADPLIGSVHDPIYQGAGSLGQAGIPQPKPGAVTKAHGGILFIDEIGELHPIQMNKLLKVLEDRKVFLESAYYNPEDRNIPQYIHDIFQNGLPADFRLVGATTRLPEEISPAIRSRCVEIFFKPLSVSQIGKIARDALAKIDLEIDADAVSLIQQYAKNGREAVNLVQIAAGIAMTENKDRLTKEEVEWVIHNSQLSPRPEKRISPRPQIGVVNGLAVYGPNMGVLIEIEATARPVKEGHGQLTATGMVEEEELAGNRRTLRRKSMSVGSLENVITVLKHVANIDTTAYDIHVNFPGGIPIDGPSAGVAIATAIYSAVRQIPVDNQVAMTGEIGIHGQVKAVGGIVAKVLAAKEAGATKVLVPKDNWQSIFAEMEGIKVIPVEEIKEVFSHTLIVDNHFEELGMPVPAGELLSAQGLLYQAESELDIC